MGSFENAHPRDRGGRFTNKENSSPTGALLDETSYPEDDWHERAEDFFAAVASGELQPDFEQPEQSGYFIPEDDTPPF